MRRAVSTYSLAGLHRSPQGDTHRALVDVSNSTRNVHTISHGNGRDRRHSEGNEPIANVCDRPIQLFFDSVAVPTRQQHDQQEGRYIKTPAGTVKNGTTCKEPRRGGQDDMTKYAVS